MDSVNVKRLLSKLTGIDLIKESMADVSGVLNIKNRKIEWHPIGNVEQLKGVPEIVVENIREMQSNFANSFNGAQMIFSYVGEDPAIPATSLDMIEKDASLPPEKKQQFMKVIRFMDQFGIRLLMSPRAMAYSKTKGDKSKVNGSEFFFNNFGYAWGASKVPTGKVRSAYPITEINLQQSPREG